MFGKTKNSVGGSFLIVKPSKMSQFKVKFHYSASIIVCFMGHTVQSIKEVIKLIKALKFVIYDTVSDVVESKVHQCQQNSDA